MEDRIDFALEPGVIVFAVLCFVLINALIAAVLYPYLNEEEADEEIDSSFPEEEGVTAGFMDESSSEEQSLEERIDRFHKEISDGK